MHTRERSNSGAVHLNSSNPELSEIIDVIDKAQNTSMVTVDESEVQTLASKAMNFEHSSGAFTIDDLTSLLAHFKGVDRASVDGTLSRNEFVRCFSRLGVRGFFVDVLFDAFTWDDDFSVTNINIKDFMCGFTLLTKGKAEDKLAIVFSLYDNLSGVCTIEQIVTILRCMHDVLGHMVTSSSEIPSDREEFTTVMMHHIHTVASVGGRPVKQVTLQQLILASKQFPKFYACMDSLQEIATDGTSILPGSRSPSVTASGGNSTQYMTNRSRLYDRAGRTGLARFCACLDTHDSHNHHADRTLSEDRSAMARLTTTSAINGGPIDATPKTAEESGVSKDALMDVMLGRDSWHIMLSFLMGVRRCVERLALQQIEIVPSSFKKAREITVPCHDPAHMDLRTTLSMREYSPAVFQAIRRLYNIPDNEYIRSLTPTPILGNLLLGNLQRLSTLVSEGKSGSLLYFSEDGRYVIKTISRREQKTFLRVLQNYFDYVRSNPHTLIIRFLGLYNMRLLRGRTLHFVIMANVFETKLEIHRRFDIKGSTVGRSAIKGAGPSSHVLDSVCLKDNDLDFMFLLPHNLRRDLVVQLASDAQWLATYGLMDYSLLIGIHFPSRDRSPKSRNREELWKWRSRFQNHKGGMKSLLSKDKEQTIIFVGIIDCFTTYDLKKRGERIFKILSGGDRKGLSVMPPQLYAQRFINACCENVFADAHQMSVGEDNQEGEILEVVDLR